MLLLSTPRFGANLSAIGFASLKPSCAGLPLQVGSAQVDDRNPTEGRKPWKPRFPSRSVAQQSPR